MSVPRALGTHFRAWFWRVVLIRNRGQYLGDVETVSIDAERSGLNYLSLTAAAAFAGESMSMFGDTWIFVFVIVGLVGEGTGADDVVERRPLQTLRQSFSHRRPIRSRPLFDWWRKLMTKSKSTKSDPVVGPVAAMSTISSAKDDTETILRTLI
jgi:hypothetical protein